MKVKNLLSRKKIFFLIVCLSILINSNCLVFAGLPYDCRNHMNASVGFPATCNSSNDCCKDITTGLWECLSPSNCCNGQFGAGHTCCSGTLVPSEECCSGTVISSGEICCMGIVFPKLTPTTTCCGSLSFDPANNLQICCSGMLVDKTISTLDCCGGMLIDTSIEGCCSTVFGNAVFNQSTESCCNGMVILGSASTVLCCKYMAFGPIPPTYPSQQCCDNDSLSMSYVYYPHAQSCCNGMVHTIPESMNLCCKDLATNNYFANNISPNTTNQFQCCENGTAYDNSEIICCNGMTYGMLGTPVNQICCLDMVYPSMHTLSSTPSNPNMQNFCCGNQIVNNITTCCVGNSPEPCPTCLTNTDCNDSNACTDNICTSGGCTYPSISTDDGNACTTDSCDPAVGLQHVPISTDDGNACTTDSCDPAVGLQHVPISTDDGNACTTDSCDPISGITHTPVLCDDGIFCTTDSCDLTSGLCIHNPITSCCTNIIDCDDSNICTVDNCLTNTCSHTPIAGCSTTCATGEIQCTGTQSPYSICCSSSQACGINNIPSCVPLTSPSPPPSCVGMSGGIYEAGASQCRPDGNVQYCVPSGSPGLDCCPLGIGGGCTQISSSPSSDPMNPGMSFAQCNNCSGITCTGNTSSVNICGTPLQRCCSITEVCGYETNGDPKCEPSPPPST